MKQNSNSPSIVEQQIWEIIGLIRGEIDIRGYHVITVIIALKRLEVVKSIDIEKRMIDLDLIAIIEQYEGEFKYELLILIEAYGDVLVSLSDKTLSKLDKLTNAFNLLTADKTFGEVLELLIYNISKAEGRLSGEYLMPMELSRFASNLIETKYKNIYNPFAGLATFGVFMDTISTFLADEINRTIASIANMRLKAHGREYAFVSHNDSIKNWNPFGYTYDIIIANPPFGLDLDTSLNEGYKHIKSAEQFVIERGLKSINENGAIITLAPNGFLFRGGSEEKLRMHLIENDLLEMVISFPGGLFSNTSIPVNLILVNKNKRTKEHVRFVQADKYIQKISKKEKRLNDNALGSIVWSESANPDVLRIIHNNEIRHNEYNLSVNRYFVSEFEGQRIFNFLSPIDGLISNDKNGKLIRVQDLSDDKLNFHIDVNEIKNVEFVRNAYKIEESVLLIAAKGENLNPTYFEYEGEPIYISADIHAFRVDNIKTDIAYLIHELYSDEVLQQVKLFQNGSTRPVLRRKDFLAMKFRLPLIEDQKAIVQGIVQAIVQEKKKETELLQKIHGLESEAYEQNSFLRHSIAGPLLNIRGAFKNLKTILENQVVPQLPNLYNLKVNAASELDFGKYLGILERDITNISESIKSNGSESAFIKESILEPIEIIAFLKQYVHEVKERENLIFKVLFDFDRAAFLDDEGNQIQIHINGNEALLRTMFNNLVKNAELHAFNRTRSSNNRIEFFLTLNSEDAEVRLLVSNTGKPFPTGFDINMFIRKGSKAGLNAGDGVGGWYIDEIIKKHNGQFDIIVETESEGLPGTDFATSFEFIFPIITIE